MFAISEATARSRSVFKSFDTFAEAVDFAKSHFPIVHFEIDPDNAEAADFFTKFGTVYAIQAV